MMPTTDVTIYYGDLGADEQAFARLLAATLWNTDPLPKDVGGVVPLAVPLAAEMFPELELGERMKIVAAVLLRMNHGMRDHRLSRH